MSGGPIPPYPLTQTLPSWASRSHYPSGCRIHAALPLFPLLLLPCAPCHLRVEGGSVQDCLAPGPALAPAPEGDSCPPQGGEGLSSVLRGTFPPPPPLIPCPPLPPLQGMEEGAVCGTAQPGPAGAWGTAIMEPQLPGMVPPLQPRSALLSQCQGSCMVRPG